MPDGETLVSIKAVSYLPIGNHGRDSINQGVSEMPRGGGGAEVQSGEE